MNINIAERNPVSILNELRVGLKYDVLDQSGPSHAPNFTVAVEVDGQKYVGSGRSKKMAKSKAAEAALKSFIQFPHNCKVISPNSSNSNLDFTSDTFDSQKEEENSDGSPSKKSITQKSPIMLLNELYPSVKYECSENNGDMFSRFKIVINLNEEMFIGTGECVIFHVYGFGFKKLHLRFRFE